MLRNADNRPGLLLLGVLKILNSHLGGLQARDVLSRMEIEVPPTEHERAEYQKRPGVRRYEKSVRFSTIAAVKAGWLVKENGVWTITPTGQEALRQFPTANLLFAEVRRLYREWQELSSDNTVQPFDESSGDESETISAAATIEESIEAAWRDIERHIDNMNPYDFQNLVAGLLKGMGYFISFIAPPGADGGIDLFAHSDPLGVSVPRIAVQVRRRAQSTSVMEVRSFSGILRDTDVGIFVATGGFTRDAYEEARLRMEKRLVLIDKSKLFSLWSEFYDKIPDIDRRLLPIRIVHFLSPI